MESLCTLHMKQNSVYKSKESEENVNDDFKVHQILLSPPMLLSTSLLRTSRASMWGVHLGLHVHRHCHRFLAEECQ